MKAWKRLLSLLLCLALMVPSFATVASASETEEVVIDTITEVIPETVEAVQPETEPAETVEEAAEAIPVAEETEAVTVVEEIVEAAVEAPARSGNGPAPTLTYRWLECPEDNKWTLTHWDDSENDGQYGHSHMQRTPGENFMAFYLNTWNESTNSWDYRPVHVTFGNYLSGEKMTDGDFGFMPDAQDTAYYYHVTVEEAGWDQNTQITYSDGSVTAVVEVEIRRGESAFYSSNVMSNDTYIDIFYADQTKAENSFYYGFESDYWTLVDVNVEAEGMDIQGYDSSKAITVEPAGDGMYKITVDPELVALAWNFPVRVDRILKDHDGNINSDWSEWCQVQTNWDVRNSMTTIWMAEQGDPVSMYEFKLVDGQTKAFTLSPTSYVTPWGDQMYTYGPASLPKNVSYDLTSNTLTLNNAKLGYLCLEWAWFDRETGVTGVWLPNENATVKLVGSNELISDYTTPLQLRGGVKATFTGDGSLKVIANNSYRHDENGNAYGFSAVEIQGGATMTLAGNTKVTAEIRGEAMQTHYDGDTKLGEYTAWLDVVQGCGDGNLVMKDNARFETILPEGARTTGPKVDNPLRGEQFPGGYRGLADMGGIDIQGGTLITQEIVLGNWWNDNGNLEKYGSYKQSGGTVTIKPIGSVRETEKWEWNEETQQDDYIGIVNHYYYSGIGNHDGGLIEISGGTLNINCDVPEEELAASAYCDGLFTENIKGKIDISGGDINIDVATGCCITSGIVNISGGNVDLHSCQAGCLYALKEMNISGGTVNVECPEGGAINANDCDLTVSGNADVTCNGIMVGFWFIREDEHWPGNGDGSFVMNGGTVNLNGELGLWPCGKGLTMNGGTLNANGGISAFAPQTIQGNAKVNVRDTGWDSFQKLQVSGNAVITLKDSHLGIHDQTDESDKVVEQGILIMDGGKLILDYTRDNEETWSCIELYNGGEILQNKGDISVKAENTVGDDDHWPCAVEFSRGSKVTINGGTFTIDAKNYCQGLVNRDDLTVNGGTLTVTNHHDKEGFHLTEDGKGLIQFFTAAMHSPGYFTINGGEVNLDGFCGLDLGYDSGDVNNPDWPAWKEAKFTMNDGALNIKGLQQGLAIGIPAEIKGGKVTANIEGMFQHLSKRYVGQSMMVYPNGSEDVEAYLTISGGEHSFTAANGTDYYTYGGVIDTVDFTVTGGSVTFDATVALCAQGVDENNLQMIHVGDGLKIISQPDGKEKPILSGEYFYESTNPTTGEKFEQMFYINSFEHDDTFEAEVWWNGEADECSKLVISKPGQTEPEQPTEPDEPDEPDDPKPTGNVSRLYGEGRCETAFGVADAMKAELGIEKFDAIILTNGLQFADALAGSYLSAQKTAPILLHLENKQKIEANLDYIQKNLNKGGIVYILGGKNAVPETMDARLADLGIKTQRVEGAHRYATNLEILKVGGFSGGTVLVCTGLSFADSLSASATGLPILLVAPTATSLTQANKDFLEPYRGKCNFVIVGGTSAVKEEMKAALEEYGDVARLAGANRYETSTMVAERFFVGPEEIVVAYAITFPDGLCGGALAYAKKAPLILTYPGWTQEAEDYVSNACIRSGVVLGGNTLVNDDSVRSIFGLAEGTPIN